MFVNSNTGSLVEITGSDPVSGNWKHAAFVPAPLPATMPELSSQTFLVVADARAALAALDSTAKSVAHPTMLRCPRSDAKPQSTSALEGTYAPLAAVLTADEDEPTSIELSETSTTSRMADYGFGWVGEGRPVTITLLEDLQGQPLARHAVDSTPEKYANSQVVIGRLAHADKGLPAVNAARVHHPLARRSPRHGDCAIWWSGSDHSRIYRPVVATAMSHYQFETLHRSTRRQQAHRAGSLIVLPPIADGGPQ